MTQVCTRFAPSPTGYMHIGNLRTALYAYLFAKAEGGRFILRIEDTDRARYVEDAVKFIEDTLSAARIVPDEGPGVGGSAAPYVQSERTKIYQKYADEMIEKGFAYRCFCGERDEREKSFGGYDRHCRDLSPEEIRRRTDGGESFVIRQKMPLGGSTTFFDVVHGNITIENSELEDQVLIKRDGMPTYNFANVVDDHLMGVTHVIRGTEFITSTPKHVLTYQAFGWEPPSFVHLAPVMGKNADGSTAKLSKRHGATSFSELVDAGYLPEAIVNYVALLGWSPKSNDEIFSMDELISVFSLDGLSKSPAVFDYAKLGWVNGEYIKKMDAAAFARVALPFAGEVGRGLGEKWPSLASILKTRVSRLGEIPEMIAFLGKLSEYDASLFQNKRNKVTPELAAGILPEVRDVLAALDGWEHAALDSLLHAYAEGRGLKLGTLMWPMRIALSGKPVTPGAVTDLLYLLGRDESLDRLEKALQKLR